MGPRRAKINLCMTVVRGARVSVGFTGPQAETGVPSLLSMTFGLIQGLQRLGLSLALSPPLHFGHCFRSINPAALPR
jgi:hypothetical protein